MRQIDPDGLDGIANSIEFEQHSGVKALDFGQRAQVDELLTEAYINVRKAEIIVRQAEVPF